MFKMSLHNPFEHLKHKLGPKERLGIKLTIWLPTTKSRESPRFPCVQVACDISLESSWWGLQPFFKPHLNQWSTNKIVGPQSCERPVMRISRLPGQNDIWVLVPWPGTKYTIRGKVVVSPKPGLLWILWIQICLWLVLAPKMQQLVV